MGLPWLVRTEVVTVLLVSVGYLLLTQNTLSQPIEVCSPKGREIDISGCSRIIDQEMGSCEFVGAAFANRARGYMKSGNLRRALEDYDQAIALNSRYAAAYSGKSEVLVAMGNRKEGEKYTSKAAQLDADAQAEYNLAYEAYWDSKFKAAIEGYTLALAIDPQFAYAYYGRADVYYYKEDWVRASKDYEAAVRLMSPNDPWYESGLKRLKFSRIYSADQKDMNESSISSCVESARLASGGEVKDSEVFERPSNSGSDIQTAPLTREPVTTPVTVPKSPGNEPSPTTPTEELPQPAQVPPQAPVPPSNQIYSSGTGFFVANDGYLLTNEHVVRGCKVARIMLDDRRIVPAAIMARNSEFDLALLRTLVSAPSVAKFRTSPPLRQGADIVVFGFPQFGDLSSTGNAVVGNVAALAGPGDDALHIQISAPVQRGNSGGPVLDKSGNVVGVVVWKKQFDKSGQEILQQVNFAINSDVARFFLEGQRVNYTSATTDRANAYSDTSDIAELARKFTVPIECAVDQ